MNESKRKRIRRDYEPLTVAVTLRCLTPASPVGQVFDRDSSEYEPNRSLTPTTIFPDVRAGAKDGSWSKSEVNELLTSMVWYVNGKDITTLSEWSGLYEITTEGVNKGAITIKKNVESRLVYALRFTAEFADTRLGINMKVVSDEIILTTTDKGDDNYSIALDVENDIHYDQTRDELEFYDYKIAHGIDADDDRETIINGNESYIRNIPIVAYKAKNVITSGYTVKLFKLSGTTETEVSSSDYEVVSLTLTNLQLDLRLIKKQDYVLKMYVNSVIQSKAQISVERIYPTIYCSPTNGTSILVDDKIRYDKAMVSVDGRVLDYPAAVVAIQWKVDSSSKTGVAFNEGADTYFELSKTGIGEQDGENWIDVYTEYELKPQYEVATDGSEVLTDENGEVIIFR